jgi:hypothetical protein
MLFGMRIVTKGGEVLEKIETLDPAMRNSAKSFRELRPAAARCTLDYECANTGQISISPRGLETLNGDYLSSYEAGFSPSVLITRATLGA